MTRLAGRALPRARRLDLESRDADAALHLHFRDGFAFSDCIVDDTRLTIANAFDAQSRGASINPRLRCVVAERERDRWRLSLESQLDGEWTVVLARMLVNAAGAQAGDVLDHIIHTSRHTPTRARCASARSSSGAITTAMSATPCRSPAAAWSMRCRTRLASC